MVPTPYPEVNVVLERLLKDVQVVLGDQFVGMYLYGSLASGDFELIRSDIDFIVVTIDDIPEETVIALGAMHTRLASTELPWSAKLEGAYIPRRYIRRYNPGEPETPFYNEGIFRVSHLGTDWVIQRHVVREKGVVVAGPDPKLLIDPVQPDELRQAVKGILREWWELMLSNPDPRLKDSDFQAFTILTMCRALYTLHHGEIASKPVAASWAMDSQGERWGILIESALTWQPGVKLDNLEETLEFIRFTIEQSKLSVLRSKNLLHN